MENHASMLLFFGSLTFNMSAANVTSANSDHPDTDQPDHSRIRPYKWYKELYKLKDNSDYLR